MKQAELQTWGLTLLRVTTGVIFFMHGWQKLFVNGIAGTAGFFDSIGIPLATVTAVVVSVLEFAGGAALILLRPRHPHRSAPARGRDDHRNVYGPPL